MKGSLEELVDMIKVLEDSKYLSGHMIKKKDIKVMPVYPAFVCQCGIHLGQLCIACGDLGTGKRTGNGDL
jgi:hypothetical protein